MHDIVANLGFKVVEIIEQLLGPIRLLAGLDILLGDIIRLSYSGNEVSCKLSNSRNPFGMVVGPPDQWGRVLILYSMAIMKTNNYDLAEKYEAGDLLYSNEFGKLTKKKSQDHSLLLGHVVSPPSEDNSSMEINWI